MISYHFRINNPPRTLFPGTRIGRQNDPHDTIYSWWGMTFSGALQFAQRNNKRGWLGKKIPVYVYAAAYAVGANLLTTSGSVLRQST
jgi:hypothetical protein